MALIATHVANVPDAKQLGRLHDWLYAKPSRMITIRTGIGGREDIETLVDPGSQLNLIDGVLAKELGLNVTPLPSLLAEAANGSDMGLLGATTAEVSVKDTRGRTQNHTIQFVVGKVHRYKVYLGLPWIDEHQPKMNVAARTVVLRRQDKAPEQGFQKIGLEGAEEFDRTLRNPLTDVYACLVSNVSLSNLGGQELPPQYSDYAKVASEDEARELPEHGPQDLAITLEEGATVPHMPLYNLSATELETLRAYIDEYLARGWIRRSKSPAGAPILFAKKKDGSLRLCVDYRGLNKITIKNRGPLPLIAESLNRLASARVFTKLDVRDAYHRVRIREGDEWKTAFRTRYGHFEYTVMPFGLTNAPAQFQAHMNHVLAGLVDICCIVYLDDILVFSDSEEEHVGHVKEVLDRLLQAKLFIKASKCEWHTRHTEYLGFIISPEGISVDPARVKTVKEWPLPKTVRDIRVFIGFMNYYRRFIHGFSRIALPLTRLTQKGPGSARKGRAMRQEESQPLEIGPEGRKAYEELKAAFMRVPILAHFERGRPTRVEVDASGGGICGILSQLVPEKGRAGQWRPIDFFSRKLIAAEYNYDTHDQELLAIVKSLQHWRHYLDGQHFQLLTDHHNLKWFMETKVLNHRQVRAYLVLSQFHFDLEYRKGSTNPADGPSRRPDYMEEAQKPSQKYNEAFVAPMRELLSKGNPLVTAITTRHQARQKPDGDLAKATKGYKRAEMTSMRDPETLEELQGPEPEESTAESSEADEDNTLGRARPLTGIANLKTIYTEEDKLRALQECHDDPLAGHFGRARTLERLRRKYRWEGMTKDVAQYVDACLRCKRAHAPRHKPHGLLKPLPVPEGPWKDVSMDFITDLPPSKLMGQVYDAILVIVCRFSKMAHYVPARMDWDGKDLAQAWCREVIRLHGPPDTVVSDRGPLMSAKHWRTFQYYLNGRRVLSSSFHPQTDGQTERQNQTLEQYLRIYCTLEQDDWSFWLSTAEFAYNSSQHASTGATPFQVCYGFNPQEPRWPEEPQKDGESPSAYSMVARLIELRKECRKKLEAATAYQKAYADGQRTPFELKAGDKVLVSNRHIRSTRPSKKLDWKFLGPGTVLEPIGNPATSYKIDLPGVQGVHPVFHASLLEKWEPNNAYSAFQAPIRDTLRQFGDDVYEIDHIVDRRRNEDDEWEYLVKWSGYGEEENSWEPASSISGNALKAFWDRAKTGQRRRQINIPPPVRRGRGRPPKKGREGP
jgi:hypothetical protein